MQILQSRQRNLEEGKGKEFPCCTCWRLKHSLETPAGITHGVRRGALKCPRCSVTHPHSHIHPSKTSTSTSTRSLNPQPPGSPPGAAAAPRLRDKPEPRHPGQRHRGSGSRSSQRVSAAPAGRDRAGSPGGSPAPPPRRALTSDAITAN